MRKIDEIKTHISENKKFYIGLGIGVLVGVAITPKVIQVMYKSPGSTQSVVRRMHPGNVIKCNETGEIFASERRAADLLGLSRTTLGQHLKGNQNAVNGLTFTKIGEAQAV